MITDPIPFLANIALVAWANGELTPSELGQLEAIRSEFKFKKSDFNAAVKLVEQGAYKLTSVGSFADRVKNLELILRVAYADDDLDDAEASLVNDFCKSVGIYNDQLEMIRGEVLVSLKQQGKLCPKCGSTAESEASYCPKCGVSLGKIEESIKTKFEIPSSGITIEFAESTAASFPRALELAKENSAFQSCQKGKKFWYLASYASDNITDAMPIVEALSGIRNRRVYLNGQEQSWNDIFSFAWCTTQRATAYRPVEYCFGKDENRLNSWGCKQAGMDWTEWADWFCYGKWEKSGFAGKNIQWRFDKERIRHELATNLFRYRYCPHLRLDLTEAVLKFLPDVIKPDSDPNWDYHQRYEEVPSAIKVIEKQRQGGVTFKNEFWADGVRPKGLNLLADILSKALQEIGVTYGEKLAIT